MDIKKRIQELSLDQKAKLYFMGLVRQGKIDTLPEDPKAAYVSMMMDKDDYGRSISGKDKRTFMEPEDSMPAARARKMAGLKEVASKLGYLNENQPTSISDEDLDELLDIISKYVEDPDDAQAELDRFDQGGFDALSNMVAANLDRDPEYKAWYNKLHSIEEIGMFHDPLGYEPDNDDDEDLTFEPEDMDNPDEDLVIIGSGYLDIKSNFKGRPNMTNDELATLGQKVVDQLHNGDKDAALNYIYSRINEDRDEEDEENDRNLAVDDIPDSLREIATKLGYLKEEKNCGCGKNPCETYGTINENKVNISYTDPGFRFYKMKVDGKRLDREEGTKYLKDLGIDMEIPRSYDESILDKIVAQLKEKGIDADHDAAMDVS